MRTERPTSVTARALAAALFAWALLTAAPLAGAAYRTASLAQKTSSKNAAKPEADPTQSAIVRPAEAAELAALPEGPGKTLVAERCLLCHSAGMIAQQRKDAAAWGRTVTTMRTWGTPIQDAEQAALVTYLAEHFGQAAKKP